MRYALVVIAADGTVSVIGPYVSQASAETRAGYAAANWPDATVQVIQMEGDSAVFGAPLGNRKPR